MTSYLVKRIFLAVITLFFIGTLLFFLMEAISKVPVKIGPPSENAIQEYNDSLIELGLNKSVGERYKDYLNNLFVLGNLGLVYESRKYEVSKIFFTNFSFSALLMGISFVISLIIGLSLGIFLGYRRNATVNAIVTAILVALMVIPSFVIAGVAIVVGTKTNLPTFFVSPDLGG